MSAPSISVVIPVFNTPRSNLDECISCLSLQTFDDFEVIIVDDGSGEQTAAMLDEICLRDVEIRVLHMENQGVSVARNIGLRNALGKTVCFIDSDDVFAPWLLEDLWWGLNSTQSDACYSYFGIEGEGFKGFTRERDVLSDVPWNYLEKKALIGTIDFKEACGFLSLGPCAALYRTEIAREITFDRDISLMEDVIWNIRFLRAGSSFAVLRETIYLYKMNAFSATHSYNEDVVDSRIKALKRLKSEVTSENLEWFALRTLSSYFACCKAIMWSKGNIAFRQRLKSARKMGMQPMWDEFKRPYISKQWSLHQKVKKWMAEIGIVPFILFIKGE